MIYPTLKVGVERTTGTDIHGQPRLGPLAGALVAPIKLIFTTQHTTVRTDSAASHGQAEEQIANVQFLIRPRVDMEINDVVTILGNKVRVTSKHARYTVTGSLDHYHIDCVAWV